MGRTAIRLAYSRVSAQIQEETMLDSIVKAHIFDIGAWVDSDHVAMLNPQVVSNNSVNSGTAIIKIIIGEDNKNSILPLLASNKNCVTAEQLELLHGVVGKSDDRVVIVDCIGNPVAYELAQSAESNIGTKQCLHQLVGLLLLF
jgi:hypothetical protein